MTVPKLVLTGGPCAGKTTALAYVSEKLADRGFHPLIVPEAPTLLMLGNATPKAYDELDFQRGVVTMMHQLEETFGRIAASRPELKPVIICDRGIPDCPPYFRNPSQYEQVLRELGLGSPVEVRDGRYKGVFHLRSAALGAESFYTTENNKARRETLEEARERDQQTLAAWNGHSHLRVIDNRTDFAGKLRRLDQEICGLLGIPVPKEMERKFLCEPVRPELIPVPAQRIEIEQVYLYSPEPGVTVRVRKRGQHGSYVYYRTEKRFVRPGVNIETEDFITAQEYAWSQHFRQPERLPIRKERWCFVWKEQYFELDLIERHGGTLYLMELELTEERQAISLPPFIPVRREVTEDPAYSNYELAAAA